VEKIAVARLLPLPLGIARQAMALLSLCKRMAMDVLLIIYSIHSEKSLL
jgi:hypothetical protein